MSQNTESGNVAETTVAYNDFQLDPAYHDGKGEPPRVWPESQYLRQLVEARPTKPVEADRTLLTRAVFRQLRSLELYRLVGEFIAVGAQARKPAPENLLTLYVLLFPGEGKDKTGIKDLNDDVLGYGYTSEFVDARKKAIGETFAPGTGTGPGYVTFGQDYKTASILARGKTPEDVAKDLVILDEKLRGALLAVLDKAIQDETRAVTEPMKAECRTLKRTLTRETKYRFDYLFGSRSKVVHGNQLDNTFLLITEALKGAGIARFGVKGRRLRTAHAQGMAAGRVPPTPPKHDDRGQPYVDSPLVYLTVSAAAPAIKKYILDSGSQGQPLFFRRVFVDKVWTDAFLRYRLLYFGNPDVIRDVRKKALVRPAATEGIQLKYNFEVQRELLELWLVALNLVDFVSGFLQSEYADKLLHHHQRASGAVDDLVQNRDVRWDRLTPILTCDVRQSFPIAVLGATSEFQFYAYASDHPQQLFFTMDIRDLGVDLMLFYELANKKIVDTQLTDDALLAETLHSSDRIVERKRATYDKVRAVFKHYHDTVTLTTGLRARYDADLALGTPADISGPLPRFEQSIQLMAGGDEIFVAAHPLYATHVTQIIQDLDHVAVGNQPLNLRAGVAYSSAKRAIVAGPDLGPNISRDQRKNNQLAHDEALTASSNALNHLKPFERAHRRMERLIQKLEDSKKKSKNDLAPGYHKKLDELKLLEMYVRAKYGHAKRLPRPVYARMIQALREENVSAAAAAGVQLVDFTGNIVDGDKLLDRAGELQAALRRDVGSENFHVDPLPVNKQPQVPKWVPEWVLDVIDEIFPKLRDTEKPKKTPLPA